MKKGILTGVILAIVALSCGGGLGGGGGLTDDLALLVSPTKLTFETTIVGEQRTKTITLKHVGTSGKVVITSVSLIQKPDGPFSITQPDKMELEPGEATFIAVTYAPTSGVQETGEVVIRHNVPTANYENRVPITTLAPVGDLIVIPDPIDFGDVPGGSSKDLDVILKNNGAKPVVITNLMLNVNQSNDFEILSVTVENPPDPEHPLPCTLASGQEIGLTIRYTPKMGGCDEQTLLVLLEGEATPTTGFQVTGCELGPKLVAIPGQIDFGWKKEGEHDVKLLTIQNAGNYELIIQSVAPTTVKTDPEIRVDDPPAAGTKLNPGEELSVHVSWTAYIANLKGQFAPGEPIGGIIIESSDPASPTLIPVFGGVDAPEITLIPNDVVDFGVVGQGITAKRTLTIRNDGHGTLIILANGLEIDKAADKLDEFMIEPDPEFGPTTGSGEGAIEDYYAHAIVISFTNKGPATGTVQVPLKVRSNCSGKEELTVILKAQRAGTPTCDPVLVPATTNFGTVPFGFTKTLKVNIHNKGTGNCSFATARIADCTTMMGLGTSCPNPFKATASQNFVIPPGGTPPGIMNGIGPGMDAQITVKYQPTGSSSIWGVPNQFDALLAVKILDSNIPNQPPKEIQIPAGSDTGMAKPNLTGQSGQAKIAVLPGEVKFGLVTIGCYSKTYKICVYNTGNAPLTLSEIVLDPSCSKEFKLKNVPGLPKAVSAGVPVCFETVYAPLDTSEDSCIIQVKSDEQGASVVTVGLSGQGTYESEQTDIFTQVSGQSVDVLFVIDDSGSMCDDQQKLIAAYASFVDNAEVWNNDYHIGLIDVNVLDPIMMGKLNRGNPNPPARFLTPSTPNGKDKFKVMADMGCDGTAKWAKGGLDFISDNQEAGLQAAQMALSAPETTETGVPCSTTTDCQNNKSLCGDPKSCPYYCIEGTCGGWNKGFLRDDAQLEIVILSDEEDQSSAAVSFYIDFFKNIKGFYNTSMLHIHSIVGQPQSTCAEPGKRYIETSQQTNGKIGDICDNNYSPIMDQIGKVAFGLKVQFFLSRLADPPTVTVSVDGKKCTSGWKYDTPSNSVVFDGKDPSDPCSQPQPGQKIVIHYKTLCLTS